jgi:hypothetical protein
MCGSRGRTQSSTSHVCVRERMHETATIEFGYTYLLCFAYQAHKTYARRLELDLLICDWFIMQRARAHWCMCKHVRIHVHIRALQLHAQLHVARALQLRMLGARTRACVI